MIEGSAQGVPPGLAAAMAALGASAPNDLARGRQLLLAATNEARRLVEDPDQGRVQAIRLLAIDAVVTQAVAAMADTPATFEAECEWALEQWSTLMQSP